MNFLVSFGYQWYCLRDIKHAHTFFWFCILVFMATYKTRYWCTWLKEHVYKVSQQQEFWVPHINHKWKLQGNTQRTFISINKDWHASARLLTFSHMSYTHISLTLFKISIKLYLMASLTQITLRLIFFLLSTLINGLVVLY